MLKRCAKVCLLIIGGIGAIAFWLGGWISLDYGNRMPKQASAERTLELGVGHGHKVFVTNQEYDKYHNYQMWANIGIWTAIPAIGVLASLNLAKRKDL